MIYSTDIRASPAVLTTGVLPNFFSRFLANVGDALASRSVLG